MRRCERAMPQRRKPHLYPMTEEQYAAYQDKRDLRWARDLLAAPRPGRLDNLISEMCAGSNDAYDEVAYLVEQFNAGTPCTSEDGSTMVTADDGYLKDAEQTLRGRMATGPDGRLS